MSDDQFLLSGIPPELFEAVETAQLELLPKKSRESTINGTLPENIICPKKFCLEC